MDNLLIHFDINSHCHFTEYVGDNNSVHLAALSGNGLRKKPIVHGMHIFARVLSIICKSDFDSITGIVCKFLSPVFVGDRVKISFHQEPNSITVFGKSVSGNVFEILFTKGKIPLFSTGSSSHKLNDNSFFEFFNQRNFQYSRGKIDYSCLTWVSNPDIENCLNFFGGLSSYLGTKKPGDLSVIGEVRVSCDAGLRSLKLEMIKELFFAEVLQSYSLGMVGSGFKLRVTGNSGIRPTPRLTKIATKNDKEIISKFVKDADCCIVFGSLGKVGSFFASEVSKLGFQVFGTTGNIERAGNYKTELGHSVEVSFVSDEVDWLDYLIEKSKNFNVKAVFFCNSPPINSSIVENDFNVMRYFNNVYVNQVTHIVACCKFVEIKNLVVPGSVFEDSPPKGLLFYSISKKISSLLLSSLNEVECEVNIINPKLPPIENISGNEWINFVKLSIVENFN